MTRDHHYEAGEGDFDPEEDIAQLEHYQLHGDKQRLMPDLAAVAGGMLSETFHGCDSIYG